MPGSEHVSGGVRKAPRAGSAAALATVQNSNGATYAPTALTVTYTTAPTPGDVLVVFLHNNGNSSGGANSYAAPAGWTQIDLDTTHAYQTYEAFYHVAGASEPKTYSFTPSCACKEHIWNALEFSGVDTSSPIDKHGYSFPNNTTSWNTPSETPSQAGDLAVVAMLSTATSQTWTSNSAGWTVDISGETWSGEVLQESVTGTSPVSESSTLSASSYGYAAIVLLNPSPGGPPPSTSPSPSPSSSPPPGGGTPPKLVQKTDADTYAPTSVTVTYNTTPVQGDLLIVFLHNNGDSSGGANSYTAPAGWTQIDLDTTHAYQTYEAFYHVAGAAEPISYGFAPSCACKEHIWNAFEFSGANTSSPIDKHGFNFPNNTTSWNTPSETPSQVGDLAVAAMLSTASNQTWTSNSSGWTVDISGETWSGEVLQEGLSSAATVSESSTLSASSYGYAAIVLLNPSSGGGGGPSPTPTPSPGAKVDWPTWGMKPTRNSYNPAETTLTTSNVAGLHQLWQFTTGGVITAAPVLAANVSVAGGGTKDILYVGDHHGNFYALDANSGAQIWSTTKQTTYVNPSNGCTDQPGGLYGVGGSATIDRSGSRVYFVDGQGNLYAYDLATATQEAGPVAMWPFQNGVNITNDYGALNEDAGAGVIYVPAGAQCGDANYGGIERYTIASGAVAHFYTEGGPPNTYGGVWGPGGAVIDPRSLSNSSMNNIYFGTAYGPLGNGVYPYSVVRLTSSLGFVAANNPVTTTCCPDLDFGDTPLVITPSPSSGCGRTLAIAESKNAMMYVYDADSIGSGPIQAFALGESSENGQNIGTAAYDPTKNMLFIPNGSDAVSSTPGFPAMHHGLVAFTITSACQLAFAWQDPVGPNQVHDGPPAPPTIANGVVYYSDSIGTSGCSPVGDPKCSGGANFYAFNETNGATLLRLNFPLGMFTEPVVVNGKVYLTTWNGQGPGIVYGLGL